MLLRSRPPCQQISDPLFGPWGLELRGQELIERLVRPDLVILSRARKNVRFSVRYVSGRDSFGALSSPALRFFFSR